MAGPAKKAAAKKPVAKKATPSTEQAAPAEAAPAPARRTTPLAASGSKWSLSYRVAAFVLVVAAFGLLLKMMEQERTGPAHTEQYGIGDGLPATLYLPQDSIDHGREFPTQPPKDERPPVIVMSHGYSVDRASMSGLARSLARAGYAVLSIDLRGHGANTHPFEGDLKDDFAAAVDWAESSPYVDGERIAVLGHSMGAGAVLEFATTDRRPKAVIPVSGGSVANDEVVPAHTLFLVASGDPDRIKDDQRAMAKVLKAAGGDVVSHTVSGVDHVRILRRSDTVASITEFLDPIMGIERSGPAPGMDDPRYRTGALYLLVALALIGMLGLAMGQAVPAPAAAGDPRSRPSSLGFLLPLGALVLTMPLLSAGGFDLLPLGAGQPIAMHLGLAGALLWGGRALARRDQIGGTTGGLLAEGQWLPLRGALVPGLAAAGAIVALLLPLAPLFHRMVPSPARALYWLVLSAVALPFFAAYEALTRRGRNGTAIAAGIGGKVLLLVVMFVGVGLGLLPFVIGLVAPLLILQYVLLELFASTAFARGRNTAVIAVVEAVLVGFVVATLSPVW
jgi:dienelactone hydrolase